MIGLNRKKIMEAVAVLLRDRPAKRMNYRRLLKLLYLAERASLEKRGRPLCGDRPVAMKQGPVMSVTYDFIMGADIQADEWSRLFRKDGYELAMRKADHPPSHLSRSDVEIIQETADHFADFDDEQLLEYCHELAEYKKNEPNLLAGEKQRPIPFADVLEAVGRLEQKDAIFAAVNASLAADRLFHAHDLTDAQ